MADHVDHRVLPAQRNGPEEGLTPDVVDAEDRVPVVAAGEARAEHRRAARPVAEEEVDAAVSHLPGRGNRRSKPQAVRLTPIDVDGQRAAAVPDREVYSDVHGAVLFPWERAGDARPV